MIILQLQSLVDSLNHQTSALFRAHTFTIRICIGSPSARSSSSLASVISASYSSADVTPFPRSAGLTVLKAAYIHNKLHGVSEEEEICLHIFGTHFTNCVLDLILLEV
jgi:hypothetical protein